MDSRLLTGLLVAAVYTGFLGLAPSIPLLEEGVGEYGSAHEHLYLAVQVNGKRVDLSQRQYQLQSKLAHFEGGNGKILHLHAERVDLGFALDTLGMKLEQGCLEAKRSFCTNATHEARVYVNGEVVDNPNEYVLSQGDNVMVWYGKKSEQPDPAFFTKQLPRAYRPNTGSGV
jgi:hypothetical protein